MAPSTPRTREAICAALATLHEESVQYWSTLSTAQFLAPINDAWSPADNVRHLTKSMRAVTTGLGMHWLILRLRFGAADGAARTYEQIRVAYKKALLAGGTAGPFAPKPLENVQDPEAERERIMEQHRVAREALCAATMRWDQESFDKLRLPHPLLGKLSLREMMLFTLYHNLHHVDNVKNRRGVTLTADHPLRR